MTTTVSDDSYSASDVPTGNGATYDAGSRWQFDWVAPALLKPRQTFSQVVTAGSGIWQTPLLILLLAGLGRTLVAGSIKQAAAASGQVTLPPGFEYYTPEQQAQFQQAMTATSGPVFSYVLPSLATVLVIVMGWLIIGWLLHLVLTLLGGRSPAIQTLNVVAWAGLPFAVRDGVRIAAMLNSNQLISYPGLSGFVTLDGSSTMLYLAALLALVDIYLLAFIGLTGLGVRLGDHLTAGKAWTAVIVTLLSLLLIRALPALISGQFNDLTIIRPFF